ncbi:hypothetical protein [Sediminicoccus sp. KRV36]|uniref:hypothetical protein n=1 Tax=Sediminicoccus sp. KRV36 TaxID=3133721 RepID=UPI00200F06D1|nr:hypothetical protein [Sediminicoccus rosea]UPY37031.1 hypothetical protein LHU95_22910 [Sediminicoccus rosea]
MDDKPGDSPLLTRLRALAAELGPPFDSPHGQRALGMLLSAHTDAEHRRGAAEVALFLYRELARALPPRPASDPLNPAARLGHLLISPPNPGAGTKPARDQQAIDDAWMLGLNTDFDTLARSLVKSDGVTLAAARRRLERAEKLTGLKAPRRLAFGRRSPAKKDH